MKNLHLICLFVLFMCISCGTTSDMGHYSYNSASAPVYTSNQNEQLQLAKLKPGNGEDILNAEAQAPEEKIVIYNAYLSLTVTSIDSTNNKLKDIAKQYDGYVLKAGSYRTVIRVRSQKFNDAVKEISAAGKLTDKEITGEDVTDEYKDYTIRLDNAVKSRQRYLELLAKAQSVEETLKVEKELERLNGEIDLLTGKIKRLNHLDEFSTITISLHTKVKLGLLGYVFKGAFLGVKWLFVRT